MMEPYFLTMHYLEKYQDKMIVAGCYLLLAFPRKLFLTNADSQFWQSGSVAVWCWNPSIMACALGEERISSND